MNGYLSGTVVAKNKGGGSHCQTTSFIRFYCAKHIDFPEEKSKNQWISTFRNETRPKQSIPAIISRA